MGFPRFLRRVQGFGVFGKLQFNGATKFSALMHTFVRCHVNLKHCSRGAARSQKTEASLHSECRNAAARPARLSANFS